MSWIVGNQKIKKRRFISNDEIAKISGPLEEKEAKILLYHFLRNNITYAAFLLLGEELFPVQHLLIRGMLDSDSTLAVLGRGMSKTWSAAIYAILECMFNDGIEIGVISRTFRQSQMILSKIEKIAQNKGAAFFRQCLKDPSNPVRKGTSEWVVNIGKSKIIAVPLGDGEKLRGYRFQRIIIDEFLLMPEQIFNEVIMPFASVNLNPQERDKMTKAEDEMIAKGKMKPEERYVWPNNKIICLSSASYKFEYLHKLYRQFEEMIIDPSKKKQEDLDGTKMIFHMSYDCAPKAIYNAVIVNQNKKTMSESQFNREYHAVFTDDSSGYFRMSKMVLCCLPDGQKPTSQLAGNVDAEYALAIDPSWSDNDNSDNFAMHVLLLDQETKTATVVHSYALAGASLSDHIFYYHYLLTHFNIKIICADRNGGLVFVAAANESELFKSSRMKIESIDVDFNDDTQYQIDLIKMKNYYNLEQKRILIQRNPSSAWIRKANEQLQGSFDHRRIFFASKALNDDYHIQTSKPIPIEKLKFSKEKEINNKENGAKMIDFLEIQDARFQETLAECARIQPTTTAQGFQSFDLPSSLSSQGGADRPRKDLYSALLLGNWIAKIYFDMQDVQGYGGSDSFVPFLI
jgi:hypothetical protein